MRISPSVKYKSDYLASIKIAYITQITPESKEES